MSTVAEDKMDNTDNTLAKKAKGKKEKKDDPGRFQGAGISFKAKLIGTESVPEARGDKMCQDAMAKLKMMVKAAGEHKQRIMVNVSLEGLKICDEKSGSILHHHAVHKISFISRDTTDGRAFGYVYGLGDGNHDFYGIKTEKPAEGLVLTLRDLFQVVFEMKKREVEAQKQKQKDEEEEKKNEDIDNEKNEKSADTVQAQNESAYDDKGETQAEPEEKKEEGGQLLDLETELNFLEQGIAQMNTFDTGNAWGASSGFNSPATPQRGLQQQPSFPVSFDSPTGAQPQPFGAPAQNDPFNTQAPGMGGVASPQQNLFSNDPFVPPRSPAGMQPAFAQFGGGSGQNSPLPGTASPALHPRFAQPGSGSNSPLPGGASPVPGFGQQDPFKNDPFFSAGTDNSDKYSAIKVLSDSNPGSRRGSSDLVSQDTPNMFAAQDVFSSPLQPSPVPSNNSPVPTSGGDPFSSLDIIGGNKPQTDKKDFFKQNKPAMNQLGGPTSPGGQQQMTKPADPFNMGFTSNPAMMGGQPQQPQMGFPQQQQPQQMGTMGMPGMMPNGSMMPGAQFSGQQQQMPGVQMPGMMQQGMRPPHSVGNPFLNQ